MDAGSAVLLVAIALIVALITYAVWRNHKVKTSVGVGPININLDTERVVEQPGREAPATAKKAELSDAHPTARISLGNVQQSEITNESAGGDAEIKAGNVSRSRIVNTAGAAADKARNKGADAQSTHQT